MWDAASIAATDLPPSLADALRPALPELAEATIAAIGRDVPAYARPLEGPFGAGLRAGVERALERFVDDLADPGRVDDEVRALYVELGRGEFRAGRTLDALLSAYRIGARLAWERFQAAGEAAGHEPATLYRLAGAIFSYIDAVSAESVEGFAQARAAAEGERRRVRRALVRVLGREGATPEEVTEAAREAGWPVRSAVAAVVATGEGRVAALEAALGADVAAAAEDGVTVAFVADPEAPGRGAVVARALGDDPAAVGPAVPTARAAVSLHRARCAHALVVEGRLAGPVARAEDHLVALLLHGTDPVLAADLAQRELAPLQGLTAGSRQRLTATLRAWLDRPGQVQRVAEALGVHPQTVRYRLGRLRELLGDALEDPERCFALGLALRIAEEAPGPTTAAGAVSRPAGR